MQLYQLEVYLSAVQIALCLKGPFVFAASIIAPLGSGGVEAAGPSAVRVCENWVSVLVCSGRARRGRHEDGGATLNVMCRRLLPAD